MDAILEYVLAGFWTKEILFTDRISVRTQADINLRMPYRDDKDDLKKLECEMISEATKITVDSTRVRYGGNRRGKDFNSRRSYWLKMAGRR